MSRCQHFLVEAKCELPLAHRGPCVSVTYDGRWHYAAGPAHLAGEQPVKGEAWARKERAFHNYILAVEKNWRIRNRIALDNEQSKQKWKDIGTSRQECDDALDELHASIVDAIEEEP